MALMSSPRKPDSASAALMLLTMPSHQSAGSCSLQSGWGLADGLRAIGDGDDLARVVYNQRFGAGGADVESHEVGHGVSFLSYAPIPGPLPPK